ncbi:hypothetical protein RGF97_24135 [Streptomyces roseicoloratus]|uniref:Lipoprotein n=1 Tax=Streptomyces roseicoloratus TaxID=2508722 RepID=A0ABY9RYN9_9ACTN|nr:hypothetical protein [Streptomyces roseicoloratus]WMX47291.1 hypothetical protein RGF97_24135 [Streptomyces roseicoloratus]
MPAAPRPASTAGGGAGTGGDEALTADDVKQEIETAATGAGFVQAATGDQVPPGLEKCMVSWSAEAKKAADPKKSYTDTVAALGKESWKTDKTFSQSGSTITSLSKGGWQLKASDHSAGVLKLVMFIATDTSPACEALFKADLEKSKQ